MFWLLLNTLDKIIEAYLTIQMDGEKHACMTLYMYVDDILTVVIAKFVTTCDIVFDEYRITLVVSSHCQL